jgi:glycogen operon protein
MCCGQGVRQLDACGRRTICEGVVHIWPGHPYPLGASFDGGGTNFALFSEVADRIELCLFNDGGSETRVDLPERYGLVWHGYLPRIGPGQRYGYRVHGPYDPAAALRCNPAKLLLDPYAKAIDGRIRWDEALFSFQFGGTTGRNDADSAPFAMTSVVVNPFFDWGDDRLLRSPTTRHDLRGARQGDDDVPPGDPRGRPR